MPPHWKNVKRSADSSPRYRLMCGIGHDAEQGRRTRESTLEDRIIAHCAPTLAGLKSACLFSYFYSDALSVKEELSRINGMLNGKGVFAEALLWRGDFVLLYVYRMSQLRRDLTGAAYGIRLFVRQRGRMSCAFERKTV